VNGTVANSHHNQQVISMSGNKRSARFPVSAAFQTGPVVEPDADYDARSTTWEPRSRPREQSASKTLAIVAGALAVSAAIVYLLVKSRQSDAAAETLTPTAMASRDHDRSKGAIEDERPSEGTNAPGLDNEGMPNDERAITEDALGARSDGTQG
jgi:hypothetical protein